MKFGMRFKKINPFSLTHTAQALLLVLGVFLAAFFSQYAPAHALSVDSIRIGQHPDKTRLVLEVSETTEFRAFTLSEPYRMVIDLPHFDWRISQSPISKEAGLTAVRQGELKPGISRIVFDLNGPKAIQSAFMLPGHNSRPNRLVVDFSSVSTAGFQQVKGQTYGQLDHTKLALPKTTIEPYKTASLSNVVPAAPKPAVKAKPAPKPLIVLDPGHGGQDPGAIGANGVHEKTIVFALAKELKKQLEATGKYRVLMTRTKDVYIRLHERVAYARKHEADLFVSIHADSIKKPGVSGVSIYTLSEKASDKQTARLAAKENLSDAIAGFDVQVEDEEVSNILVDLAMRDTMNQSKFVANTMVDHFEVTGVKTLENPHRFAGFAVLKAADIPSILVEAGFISNKKEARLLTQPKHRAKLAKALLNGINAYFKKVDKNQAG